MNKLDKIITDSLFEGLNKINTELSADSFFELKKHIYDDVSKQLNLCGVGSSFVEYEKQVSMDAITLKDITEDNIVVGRYLLDEGKLYKIDLVEKYTLIDLK